MTTRPNLANMSRRTLLFGGAAVGLGLLGAGTLYAKRDRYAGGDMTPAQAQAAIASGAITMIDIRRPDEWAATGVAEGAHPIDMRRADFIPALLEVTDGRTDIPVALICARGVRSDRMSARLAAAGFSDVIDVPEGMLGSRAGPGWLARELPVMRP